MKKVSELCSGCTACINSCPVNAIYYNDTGLFSKPVIDENKCIHCGLCNRVCPFLSEYKQNKPEFYVGRHISNEILKSSSGGIFAVLAKYILQKKGIVYGATFNKNLVVVFDRITELKDLSKILRSKYVFSALNETFKVIKEDLDNNKQVLFSGLPCQIAGLKKYLQKDYNNLLTVDLICHGAPSNIIWKKYIKQLEKKYNSKIISVDFRYLNPKNPSKNMLIKFKNGKSINEALYENPYGKAFLTNMLFDENCYSCKFTNFHNQSDITLGDAHGYHNEKYPYKNSLILINTQKGAKFFADIKKDLILFDDFDIKELLLNNYPILHPPLRHYSAGKINSNSKSINDELLKKQNAVSTMKKDDRGVAILNFHYENYNYGANLVAYSLSETIKKLNFTPYVIDFDPFPPLDSITRLRTMGLYNFRMKHLNLTPRFNSRDQLSILNNYFDRFIVGSDQVWRKTITGSNLETYFLDFVDDSKIKVSYAASFGNNIFEGDDEQTISVLGLLHLFDAISVRENDAVNICKNNFAVNSEVCLDPTLLLNSSDYEKIIDDKYNEKIDVAVYYVMDFENTILDDKNFQRLFKNKNIVNIKGHFEKSPIGDLFIFNSVAKWLDGIRKCEYLVTDSYHGLIFGIIFKKKIICIGRNSKALSRFNSIIENLHGGIDKILYASLDDVKNISYELDYSVIYKNINLLKDKSINFLKESLTKKSMKTQNISTSVQKVIKDSKANREKAIQLEQAIADLKLQMQHYIDKTTILEKDNEYLNNQVSSLNDEMSNILNSKSWRYTKIIRKVSNKIRSNK